MARPVHKEELRPLSDLETQPSAVIRHVQNTGRPLVLTEGGRGVAVLLSMEAFEDLQISTERLELQKAIDEAEQEIARGEWVENEEMVARLKRWAGEA